MLSSIQMNPVFRWLLYSIEWLMLITLTTKEDGEKISIINKIIKMCPSATSPVIPVFHRNDRKSSGTRNEA